ncbi:MAG: TrmH family RNA methyltransferase [bacterium]|nr:TrmH family RNA methyltransferase [bacterium]
MIIVLQDVRSVHNVGSIFRTADAAGVEKIYLGGITPEPVDRFGRPDQQFVKVSLGAEKTVAWDASARSARATLKLLERLKKDGYTILAVEQSKKSIPYFKVVLRRAQDKNKLALIFGNEVNGLSSAILKKADKILEIPMQGAMVQQAHHPRRLGRGKESLNVSVAAGIIIFHFIY